MDHYVPRNSPGTPQFLIRGSEGVGWGGAGGDAIFLLYSTVFTAFHSNFAVFYSISRPPGWFFKTPKRSQNDPKTILHQSPNYPTTIPK